MYVLKVTDENSRIRIQIRIHIRNTMQEQFPSKNGNQPNGEKIQFPKQLPR